MSERGGTTILVDGSDDLDYPPDLYRADREARYIDTFEEVDERHAAFYQEQGYLAVRRAFSVSEVEDSLQGLLDVLIRADSDHCSGLQLQYESWARDRLAAIPREERQDHVRKLMRFVGHDRRLEAMAGQQGLMSVVRRLIGQEEIVLLQDMALLKPPGGGREKPWHQDKAFFTIDVGAPVVGVWIALDPASPDNGCMRVIPGSHREGPVVHFKRRDWQICDTDVLTQREVVVPLAPGGCLLFDGLMHHGTPANRTDQRRRALQFHYTAAGAHWGTDEQRLAIFGSEGKGATC